MKRQVIGVRRSSDELEDVAGNESKRMKLLNNDSQNGSHEINSNETKVVDSPPTKMYKMALLKKQAYQWDKCLASLDERVLTWYTFVVKRELRYFKDSHNQMPVESQNGSVDHISNNLPVTNHDEHLPEISGSSSTEDSANPELLNVDHNGSCDEVVVKASSSDSGIVSELYYSDSCSKSADNSEDTELSDDAKSMPVLLSYGELDAQNMKSTDSLQTQDFEERTTINESENIKSQHSSPESDNHEKDSYDKNEIRSDFNNKDTESGVRSTESKSFDLDNLALSHLKVTQFEGHTDVIFSVAVDDDIVLSSSGDTTVKVWSVEEKSLISNFSGHSDSVTCLQLLSQSQSDILKEKLQQLEISRIAITGSLDCHIKLWSVYEGHELASIYTFNGITCLGYLESEFYAVVGTEGGKLELWDVCTSKVIQSVRAHEDSVSDIKVIDYNIYSVSVDGTVKIWLFEDEDIYPVYTRKRKERSSINKVLSLAQWKTVATINNLMYLGDNTNAIKVLDSRAGRLRLFKNQLGGEGVCECVAADKDILLTSFYDSSSDTGGVNVWRLSDMTYICTLSGDVQDICSLAVVQKGNFLKIVSGGHQLLLWEFDFSRPPNKESKDLFHATEIEFIGHEIAESSVEVKSPDSTKFVASNPQEKNPNKWCNVM